MYVHPDTSTGPCDYTASGTKPVEAVHMEWRLSKKSNRPTTLNSLHHTVKALIYTWHVGGQVVGRIEWMQSWSLSLAHGVAQAPSREVFLSL